MTTKIFLLYNNEDIREYSHPDIIPLKLTQTPYFESEAFRMLEDLPNAENIGFLTPSAKRKIKDFSIENILKINPDPIVFLYKITPEISVEKQAVISHGKKFVDVWKYILDSHSISHSVMNTYVGGYSNLWLAKREFVVEFLNFAKKTIVHLDNAPSSIKDIIFSDSKYPGKLINTGILNKRFGFNHYPWHPFIMERIICLFARIKNVAKYKILRKSETRLRFDGEKIRLFRDGCRF